MDFDRLTEDSLNEKIQHELEEMKVSILTELISHLYIQSVAILKKPQRWVVTIDCLNLQKENMDAICNVVSAYNSMFATAGIRSSLLKGDQPQGHPDRIMLYLHIDKQKYREMIMGDPFDRNWR